VVARSRRAESFGCCSSSWKLEGAERGPWLCVFSYLGTFTMTRCGRDLVIFKKHADRLLCDAALLANHSDLDLTARNLPCCATRGSACRYTKSHITLVARTAVQYTAWVAHNFDDHARDFVIWVEHSCSHGPAACLVSGEVVRFHGIF
jgi:hypothetical protein